MPSNIFVLRLKFINRAESQKIEICIIVFYTKNLSIIPLLSFLIYKVKYYNTNDFNYQNYQNVPKMIKELIERWNKFKDMNIIKNFVIIIDTVWSYTKNWKQDIMMHICNLMTREVKAWASGIQGYC